MVAAINIEPGKNTSLMLSMLALRKASPIRTLDNANTLNRCGNNIGVFLNVRKCMVLLSFNENGSWFHAPYLDKHGEVDPALRRHHQLFLNQKRYDVLVRKLWLYHEIQSTIARKLEGDTNTGGWETL